MAVRCNDCRDSGVVMVELHAGKPGASCPWLPFNIYEHLAEEEHLISAGLFLRFNVGEKTNKKQAVYFYLCVFDKTFSQPSSEIDTQAFHILEWDGNCSFRRTK